MPESTSAPRPDCPLTSARRFVLANARALERHRFAHLFDDGPAQAVLDALRAYRTETGGFGHALEPDLRTAQPQPIFQEEALKIISEAGGAPDLVAGILSALPGLSTDEGGLPFTTPSAGDAPHAPWWGTDAPLPAGLNPTAGVCGQLYRLGASGAWLDRATAFCWAKLDEATETEMHSLVSVLSFLQHVPDRARAQAVFDRLAETIRARTALDPEAPGYAFGPLDFAPAPGAMAASLFAPEEVAPHLDALAVRQQGDGGWMFPWPETSPGATQEWRGIVTLRALTTLRAYGRI